MAKETISNGESGLSVRNKLNNMFTELYDKSYVIEGVQLIKNGVAKAISGIKTYIAEDEHLFIPENYDYNIFTLDIDGEVTVDGNIDFL